MTNTPDKSEMLLPCPFCGVRPVRLKNLDFSNSEAFWHPVQLGCCEPSIFDFLEPLAEALRKSGGPEIGSYFARATGGVDIEALVAKLAIPPDGEVEESFQTRVGKWMEACFTPAIIADKLERADRFIEESLELVQATGYSAERAHALAEYVFNRPVGEPFQEVGGVMVTLAALCNPHDLSMEGAAETELARVWTTIDKIRAKQATKPVGCALPVPSALKASGEE